MNQEQILNVKKNTKEIYGNKNKETLHKNHSNISIYYSSKRRNENNLKNDGETQYNNSYFFTSVYQTLKVENSCNNYQNQSKLNNINKNENKKEEKFHTRQNIALSLNPQSSFKSKNINTLINNFNEDKNYPFVEKKLNNEIDKQNKISYKINDKAGIVNSSSYRNIFTKRYSPYGSNETFSIKPVSYKGIESNINIKKNYTNKDEVKKVEVNNKKNNEKFVQKKKNHFVKTIINYKNKKSIEIQTNGIKKKNNHDKNLSKVKNNNEKMYIKYDKISNSNNNIQNYDCNKTFNNNFFHNVENNKSNNAPKIKENEEKKSNYNKNLNISHKNKNIIKQKLDINSFNNENNTKIISTVSNKFSNSLSQKGLDILNKIINNRKYKCWKIISSKLFKQKSYSNSKFFSGKIRIYKNKEKFPIIDFQNQISSTLDNEIDYNNNCSLNKIKDKYNLTLRKFSISQNIQEKYNNLLNDYLKLKTQNYNVLKDNEKLLKKIEVIKEQNKILSDYQRNNDLMIENKKLINKLKNIHTKYLTHKYIDYNENILKNVLHKLNKKAIILKYKSENINKNILHLLLKIKQTFNQRLMRKYFYEFYYKSKILYHKNENDNYEKQQKKMLVRILLLSIFHKKEINKYIYFKKYFNKFYYNCLMNKKSISYKIIYNEYIFINNENNNKRKNIEKAKKMIRLFIENITKRNNIIIKSIVKQWSLKSKLIKLESIINKGNTHFTIKNEMKSYNEKIIYKNIKEDNIIKGIKKLNDIFMIKNINKIENGNNATII